MWDCGSEVNVDLKAVRKIGGQWLVTVVVEMMQSGCQFPMEYRELLYRRGVGRTHIKNLLELSMATDTFEGLSARARNVLNNANIQSKDEVLNAINSGRLNFYRNCGAKTVLEIRCWCIPFSESLNEAESSKVKKAKLKFKKLHEKMNRLGRTAYENTIRMQIVKTCKANGWPYPPKWDKL